MNTTNLITDYIIAGILGFLTFVLPYLLIDSHIVKTLLVTEFKNTTLLTVLITAVGYSFGVVYNQFADYVEEKIYYILRSKTVAEAEKNLENELKFNHHYALQLIVSKSQSAYDYISFRRTMIRIMRAFLSFTFLVPVIHLLYVAIYLLFQRELYFSWGNLTILIGFPVVGIFIYKNLKKLYKGYYGALTNFAKILKS